MRTRGEVITDGEGNPVRLIGICEDVTASAVGREPARRDRHVIRRRHRRPFRGRGHHELDPGAERLYGYTAAEALGRRIEILLPAGRADEEGRILAQLRTRARVDPYETARCARTARSWTCR